MIYRKSDNILKEKIEEWLEKIRKNKYYNSLYLEDMIVSIIEIL